MLLRPSALDIKLILHDLGRVLSVVAVAGLLPLAWAIARQEWRPAVHILFMMGICVMAGGRRRTAEVPRPSRADWSHGLVVVALTWLIVPAVSAIPLMLSGHYGSWLDGYFDAMSGITTSGLSVIQDLDHLSDSVNVWRHTTPVPRRTGHRSRGTEPVLIVGSHQPLSGGRPGRSDLSLGCVDRPLHLAREPGPPHLRRHRTHRPWCDRTRILGRSIAVPCPHDLHGRLRHRRFQPPVELGRPITTRSATRPSSRCS
jgi:hypothetical protein